MNSGYLFRSYVRVNWIVENMLAIVFVNYLNEYG